MPDVGSPSTPLGPRDAEDSVFVGSFGGGGVYMECEDPNSDFNYVSSIFAAEGYEDSIISSDDDTPSASPIDSFDDIPLGGSELSPGRSLEKDALVLPDVASPPMAPMFYGIMTTVTTTVTTTTDDESEAAATVSIGVTTMTEAKVSTHFITILPQLTIFTACRAPRSPEELDWSCRILHLSLLLPPLPSLSVRFAFSAVTPCPFLFALDPNCPFSPFYFLPLDDFDDYDDRHELFASSNTQPIHMLSTCYRDTASLHADQPAQPYTPSIDQSIKLAFDFVPPVSSFFRWLPATRIL